ncbi:hypothetical protein MQC88_08200 [Luteimonas sp. 50]|uniref:Uncharacterized protein n=1 Tax=Cognatiluteimonas sedimenti TaxID=2927791 RepID=A0ABT0A4R8_9GAMM|nr:hypothetical protein [Lysobacter sedimenti]MCJ0825935.1 hypothetical protein [Lysobacter sedimenti]
MPLTLGMTGMDPATEADLKAAFEAANARLGGLWQLLPEGEADNVIVDMDSMYGPMSWLRLHAAGKQVIGLTSATRTQTDFHVARPFDADSIAAMLQAVAGGAAASMASAAPAAAAATTPAPAAAPTPSGMAPAPVPQDQLPEEHPQPVDEEAEPPGPVPGKPASAGAGTLAPPTIAPAASPLPPPHERTLVDWLVVGALPGRMRYRRNAGPILLIDPITRQYHGPAPLKPLAGYFEGVVAEQDFEPAEAATWTREATALGPAQPLARLQWFGGLLAGKGSLLPGHDPQGRYKLSKWPQTEREFPKHFRIATAMMKGPATLDEIAAASGVALAEVVDFVNASLVTGYAELVPDQSPEPTEPPKSGGLFGRLRGK